MKFNISLILCICFTLIFDKICGQYEHANKIDSAKQHTHEKFVSTPGNYSYIGCYADASLSTSKRAMTNKLSGSVPSVSACYVLATIHNYKYFALQNGQECWGNNNLTSATRFGQCGVPGVPTKGQLKDCYCNILCGGGVGPEYCGGGWANQVYARYI